MNRISEELDDIKSMSWFQRMRRGARNHPWLIVGAVCVVIALLALGANSGRL